MYSCSYDENDNSIVGQWKFIRDQGEVEATQKILSVLQRSIILQFRISKEW